MIRFVDTRAPRLASEFQIRPLESVRTQWDTLIANQPSATLYHRAPWLEVLERAFGVRPLVATISDDEVLSAGCLLAPSGRPLRRRLVSMPYSDFCPPLAISASAQQWFLGKMATALQNQRNLEIRGVAAAPPWRVLHHFQHWTLDLCRAFSKIESAADREVRRQVRRARESGVAIERSLDIAGVDSFFRLQLESRRRLGVPSQPRRFFHAVHEAFATHGAIETWLAFHRGRYIAAVVVLRDGDVVHAKWSTRATDGPSGASHFIFMSIVQYWAQHASYLDLGRTDIRNTGLTRFKRELGAQATPLPYSYFPRIPNVASAENLTGVWATASRVWRSLPLPLVEALSNMTYRYLA
jgi:hypothetical protein